MNLRAHETAATKISPRYIRIGKIGILELCIHERCAIATRAMQYGLRQVSTAEVCMVQAGVSPQALCISSSLAVSFLQIGIYKHGTGRSRIDQLCAAHECTFEIRLLEQGILKITALKPALGQLAALQRLAMKVLTRQVRLNTPHAIPLRILQQGLGQIPVHVKPLFLPTDRKSTV